MAFVSRNMGSIYFFMFYCMSIIKHGNNKTNTPTLSDPQFDTKR